MYYFLLSNGAGFALSRMNGMYIVMREWMVGIWGRKGTIPFLPRTDQQDSKILLPASQHRLSQFTDVILPGP